MSYKELNKIMIIEDEIDIQKIIKFSLEKLGNFSLTFYSSGSDALQHSGDFVPDLILLDVMMPKMDGLTTLKKMREIAFFKDIPVIFITAKVQSPEIMQYNELNILDVIIKPFNAMTLVDDLRTCWRKYNEQREPSN